MTRYAVDPPPVNTIVGPLPAWAATSVSTWPTNNRAFYSPFQVLRPITVSKVRVYLQASSGNLSVAVCDSAFAVLATTGAVASPGTGDRTIALTGSYTLIPGVLYYSAVSADNTTIAFLQAVSSAAVGAATVPPQSIYVDAHPVGSGAAPSNAGSRTVWVSFEP